MIQQSDIIVSQSSALFIICCSNGDNVSSVKYLLEQHRIDIKKIYNSLIVMAAFQCGNVNIVKYLYSLGAHFNYEQAKIMMNNCECKEYDRYVGLLLDLAIMKENKQRKLTLYDKKYLDLMGQLVEKKAMEIIKLKVFDDNVCYHCKCEELVDQIVRYTRYDDENKKNKHKKKILRMIVLVVQRNDDEQIESIYWKDIASIYDMIKMIAEQKIIEIF